MKIITAFIWLFISVNALAQENIIDTTSKPAITGQGKPNGTKKEMKIGKEGGSLSSTDGKLSLTIPEGAISKKTNFSIQPVTNLMPNGNGKAYQLEPSGIQFKKPIKLVFHYDPEESEDSTQLLMGIGMQDDKGQWYSLDITILDTVAKTISGNINHFSVWAPFDWLRLKAPERIKVKNNHEVNILGVNADPEMQKLYGEMSSLSSSWISPNKVTWRVNKVIKGNAEFGTLRKGKVPEEIGTWNWYFAPANVPDQNPVTISADLVGASFSIRGQIFKDLTCKAKTLIYDNAYEVTMISSIEGMSDGYFGKAVYKDTGSFVINLNGKKTKIIEKLNQNTVAELGYTGGKCTIEQIKPGYGNIHMVGVPMITLVPATSDKPGIVTIKFNRTPVMLPLLQATCPNPDGTISVSDTKKGNAMMSGMMSAFPMEIKFEAKAGEHIIVESPKGVSEIYYKFSVRRLEDDQ